MESLAQVNENICVALESDLTITWHSVLELRHQIKDLIYEMADILHISKT